jgi:hypothetical protein
VKQRNRGILHAKHWGVNEGNPLVVSRRVDAFRPACKESHFDRSMARGASGHGRSALYQIGTLASLLVYGMGWLDFDITPGRVVLLLTTVLMTQWIGDRLVGRPPFRQSARSALISGLSLCLLLRTNRPEFAVLAAIITIAAKFLISGRRKTPLQPDQRRNRRDAAQKSGVGPSRAVGLGGVLRVSDGLRGLARRQSSGAVGRDLRVHRHLLRAPLRDRTVMTMAH